MRHDHFWALITLIVAIALVVILLRTAENDDIANSQVSICVVDDTERELVRTIILRAIDQALQDQVAHLFEVWMKDRSEQPKRAVTGTNAAVDAFVRARANALKWDPPVCSDGPKLQSDESRPYVLPPRKQ